MADLTYTALIAQTATLHKEVTILAERMKERARALGEQARDASAVADMIAAINVDRDTVSEARELAKVTAGLSQATLAFVAAADTTARTAAAAAQQAQTTHSGINEAVARSGVTGIHDVNREWFRQQ